MVLTKQLACGDAVVCGCEARFLGATDDEIIERISRHALHVHHLAEINDELLTQVRLHIRRRVMPEIR